MKKIAVYLSAVPEGGGFFQYAELLLEALTEFAKEGRAELRCWCANDHWLERLAAMELPAERVIRPKGLVARLRNSLKKRLILLRYGRNSRFMQLLAPANMRIAAWKPDLVVCAQPSFFIMPGQVPQIAPIHDLMHLFEPEFPEVGSHEEIKHRNWLYDGMVHCCTALLVDSNLGKEHVLRHYHALPEQVKVLPYAASAGLLRCDRKRPEASLPEAYLFYPAQFWQHKNHLRLLLAMSRAREKCPDLHFVFSGSTRHQGYAAFNEKVQKLGLWPSVTVLGYVSTEEMAWLYSHARALVMPTLFGPTNIPPLEAMALSCPVAVSDIYAMREQCGPAALYFDPKNIDDMTSALLSLWTDEGTRAELVAKGLEHNRNWNADHMKQAFAGLLREQLESR